MQEINEKQETVPFVAQNISFDQYLHRIENSFKTIPNLNERINGFNKHITRVYQKIVDTLPKLVTQISRENEEAKIIIDYFVYQDKNDHRRLDEDVGISATIKEVSEKLNHISKRVDEMQHRDNLLFNLLKENMEKLQNVMNSIVKIKHLADEIKIFSLNSIVISAQAGSHGKGFKTISEYITSMSRISGTQANEMLTKSKEINNRYMLFNSKLHDIEEFQKNRMKNVKTDIENILSTFLESLNELALILRDLVNGMEQSKSNIFRIMRLTQNQDILKQNLEYSVELIEKTYQELKSINQYSNEYDSLEKLKDFIEYIEFAKHLLGISQKSMSHVNELTSETDESLQAEFKNILKLINGLNEDKELIIDFLVGSESGTINIKALDKIFLDSFNLVQQFLFSLKSSISRKQEIYEINIQFAKDLQELGELFNNLHKISKKFQNINVLAKIEIAKKAVLKRQKSISANTFEEMTQKTSHTIDNSHNSFLEIKETIMNSINELKESIEKHNADFQNIELDINRSNSELESSKGIITENIFNLNRYSIELSNIINESLEDINEISFLKEECNKIYEEVDGIKASIDEISADFNKTLIDRIEDSQREKLMAEHTNLEKNQFLIRHQDIIRSSEEDIEEDFTIF